jgi:hypothetical protein
MKIYQIHDEFNSFGEPMDIIAGSYLLKEKAEAELAKLEAHEKEMQQICRKCSACNLTDWLTPDEFKEYEGEACPRFEKMIMDSALVDGDVGFLISCGETYDYHDEHEYSIEEVEVIE